MRTLRVASGVFGTAAALFLAFTVSAIAQTQTFSVTLNGANEVPPVDTAATGTATVTYNPETMVLTWNVTYTGLSGPALRGEFGGPAAATANGNTIISLGNNMTSPINGSTTISAPQAAQLLAGQWYIRIRTTDHRTGEIRGQVAAAPPAP
ncbi:MAG: CHRD domain-containing protein [Bauldia sp.]